MEYAGWLFDLYAHPKKGVVLWLLMEDGRRFSFHQDFTMTFYASGPFPRLRELWRSLQHGEVRLARTRREDLYAGPQDLLQVDIPSPASYLRVFREVSAQFPDLTFYDADIPVSLRYAAAFKVFPLAHCQVTAEPNGKLLSIIALDKPEELIPKLPPLRILRIRPDIDPTHAQPRTLLVNFLRYSYRYP
jgi:hypothetical protein